MQKHGVFIVLACLLTLTFATPLDDYVAKPDSSYSWTDLGISYRGDGWTGYCLNMTSQRWLTRADWSNEHGGDNLWFHFMMVIVPDKLHYKDHALLWITGGHNGVNSVPKNDSADVMTVASVAVHNGVVGAALFQVPNQPLFFFDETPVPKKRQEDDMIGWTWKHFIEHPNQPEWLARLPMTKAAVRGMDTVTAFVQRKFGFSVQKFMVAGASKRGWTTWTTAAVDKRVVAAVPIVMDELNFVKNIHHHFRAYGGWSFALGPYYRVNMTLHMDNPVVQQMMDIVDPYTYRNRLTMPKLMISASGDEFFLPDDSRFFWDDLVGEKHVLIVPNAEHALFTGLHIVLPAVQAFAEGVLRNSARPQFKWSIDDDAGVVTLFNDAANVGKPNVTMYYAFSAEKTGRRDFRLVAGFPNPSLQLVLWTAVPIAEDKPGSNTYTAVAPRPPQGQWTGFFVMASYPAPISVGGVNFYTFTSEVGVTPNTFPFPPCYGADCYGQLL